MVLSFNCCLPLLPTSQFPVFHQLSQLHHLHSFLISHVTLIHFIQFAHAHHFICLLSFVLLLFNHLNHSIFSQLVVPLHPTISIMLALCFLMLNLLPLCLSFVLPLCRHFDLLFLYLRFDLLQLYLHFVVLSIIIFPQLYFSTALLFSPTHCSLPPHYLQQSIH
jgi:hypothetical protein